MCVWGGGGRGRAGRDQSWPAYPVPLYTPYPSECGKIHIVVEVGSTRTSKYGPIYWLCTVAKCYYSYEHGQPAG